MKSQNVLQKMLVYVIVFVLAAQTSWTMPPQVIVPADRIATRPTSLLPGQSATLLPNGTWLLLGGERARGASAAAAILNPHTGTTISLLHGLNVARAWHTATLLPNGTVLVLGGTGPKGKVVDQAEVFDPVGLAGHLVSANLTPRAHHAALLLTDGRVLIAGGRDHSGAALSTAELWDFRSSRATVLNQSFPLPRVDDRAALLADGTALFWGGADDHGNVLTFGEVYDPTLHRFLASSTLVSREPDLNVPVLSASLPEDGATDVPLDVLIGLRFSKLLRPETVSSKTVVFEAPTGPVPGLTVAAESGRLVFITPKSPLLPETKYTLTLQGPSDGDGLPLAFKFLSFTTGKAQAPPKDKGAGQGAGTDAGAQALAPLKAAPGVTALSGQALLLNGGPLPNVTFKIDNKSVRSDRTGRFLLTDITAGHHALVVDGRTAGHDGRKYGVFEAGVEIVDHQTTVLPYKTWMTELDEAHAVHVAFPTTSEVVLTTPNLPGLEFHIPPNTVITDIDGKVAQEISITPVPIAQPPFPLPAVRVPVYFTIQPGGGYIQVNSATGPKGAQLIYPNTFRQSVGARANFWNYDPDTSRGWFIYGQGSVSSNGQSIVPDQGVVLYELTGAMVGGGGCCPGNGPPPGGPPKNDGDPVDLSTGLFIYEKTDLSLPDVMPISLKRVYRQGDTTSRAFGIGTTNPYDMVISGNLNDFTTVEMVQANGSRVRFDRTAGNFWNNSTLQAVSAPGPFYGAVFTDSTPGGSGSGGFWVVTLKDGTVYNFIQPGNVGVTNPLQVALSSITDRNGNSVTLTRDANFNLIGITSPNGRWIHLTYDANNRVQTAQDNIGRAVQYLYDTQGRLTQVTDANGGVWTYGWDPTHVDQMTSITDARRIQYLTNQYDANGRVKLQTQADGSTYAFNYQMDANNNIIATTVTDPNGNLRTMTFATPPAYAPSSLFQSGGYSSTETFAVGKPEQQVYTYIRDPQTNLVTSLVDALGRQTSYTYDAMGNMMSITRLAGTPDAVTSSFTYDASFNQLTSVTDPLSHTTAISRDVHGNPVMTIDALGNFTSYTFNGAGQLVASSDMLGNTWQMAYSGADLTRVTDASGNTTTILPDAAGRPLSVTDPAGRTTQYQYNAFDKATQITDYSGGITKLQYDVNANLQSVTDARNTSSPNTFFYDNMDRLQTRTDPFGHVATFGYDGNGNRTCVTDRRGTISVYGYDGLNRLLSSGAGAVSCGGSTFESTVSYTYDAGGRVTGAVHSGTGSISLVYDPLDRLTSITTPQGSVSYGYDLAGRRTSMAVEGQSIVNYGYDNVDRVMAITQGVAGVGFNYDNDGRTASTTLPNGVVMAFGYDTDSRLTSITYQNGGSSLGNLTYGYDPTSRVNQVGGSLARTLLPSGVASANYDIANRLTSWGAIAPTYDTNGNLQTDGSNTYGWNARNQLTSITGTVSAGFQYDALGRRSSKSLGAVTTGFLYDGANILQEIAAGIPNANLLPGGSDQVFQRVDLSGGKTFLTDGLGSTMGLSDPTGTTLTSYTYDPFGNTSATGTGSTNTFQYTGRENDGTGLYYNRARYYNPVIGRFISEDPAGFSGGLNFYQYADDDPVNRKDPSGLCPWCVVAGIGGLIGGGVEGYKSYEKGCRGWDLARDVGRGFAGGAVGALAGLGAGLLGGPLAAGAASSAAADLTRAALGDGHATDNFARDVVTGTALGPVAEQLGPEVNGGNNFNPFFSPRTWGPKALQADAQEAIGDAFNGAFDPDLDPYSPYSPPGGRKDQKKPPEGSKCD